MLLIYKKLKQAREICNMSQKELAAYMQISSHSVISNYEQGKKVGISEEYIEFLMDKKFDLNSLFDHSKELRQFTDDELLQYVNTQPVMPIAAEPGKDMVDKYIAMLHTQVEDLKIDKLQMQRVIDNLQEAIKDNSAKSDGRAKSA